MIKSTKILTGLFLVSSVFVAALSFAALKPVRPVASLDDIFPATAIVLPEVVIEGSAEIDAGETVIVAAPVVKKASTAKTTRFTEYPKRDWHAPLQGPETAQVRDL